MPMLRKLIIVTILLVLLPLSIRLAAQDEDPPLIIITTVSMDEGNTGDTTVFTFVLQRQGVTANESKVDFETVDASATVADNDYQSKTGTVIFPAGSTDPQNIEINVIGDDDVEDDELFTVRLSNYVNAVPGGSSDATGIIKNDDAAPAITIAPTSISLNEGNSANVKFTLSTVPTDSVMINLVPGGKCSADSTTVTLNSTNYATGVTVKVASTENTVVEGDYTCIITTDAATSSDGRYNGINPADITLNIIDDDIDVSTAAQAVRLRPPLRLCRPPRPCPLRPPRRPSRPMATSAKSLAWPCAPVHIWAQP